MRKLHVSAPTKLFVLGEHAVVYDGRAIVTAVDARLHLIIRHEETEAGELEIHAPDVGLHHWQTNLADTLQKTDFSGESSFIESCLAVFNREVPLSGKFYIQTQSNFDPILGIGSSSATVAATLFALAQLFAPQITSMQLFEMGLEAIRAVQQKIGSGADLAAAIMGGTVYYVNQSPRQITALEIQSLPMVSVYSGKKAPTVSYVQQVKQLRDQHPAVVDPIIQTMLTIVDDGRDVINAGNWEALGRLMNIQHGLLHALGVDTPWLAAVVMAAREAGAFGAKLSGAGGGDCAVVLIENEKRVALAESLASIRREILPYELHASGVREES